MDHGIYTAKLKCKEASCLFYNQNYENKNIAIIKFINISNYIFFKDNLNTGFRIKTIYSLKKLKDLLTNKTKIKNEQSHKKCANTIH